jgi:mannose-6-phosphate isomerase-like protein (cupin superfamily)
MDPRAGLPCRAHQGLKRGELAVEEKSYKLVDFHGLDVTPCPCGFARRAFMDDPTVPYSLHLTVISRTARLHYHKHLTETYFFVECSDDAAMELDGDIVEVARGQAVMIPPGTRHRAIGEMTVVIIASPKFDPEDEWFD